MRMFGPIMILHKNTKPGVLKVIAEMVHKKV
jgi:hypothetical protein